ncbi:glutathione transferase GST 23-like [Diospyros lotus]|uniref:glutathione transferase GST 23-like n=1 Tax=Diospyros lotus TaxID=55363 RepID=UPI0022582112|nr:glutathione transferase GST 23-like [Diospyros lotus]
MGEVKLHGFWASPYSCRVIWALQLKGVKYEYVEEDLSNKSELLLQYNPIYKKVPVLVHDGKPVAESLVVLEYIEDTWPDNPLLPQDACARAMARFWIKFGEDKGLIFYDLFRSTEETKEQAGREVAQVLRTLEEQALGDGKFFGGDSLGFVDISYGWLAYWFEVMEDVIGIKVLEPSTFPGLWAWTQNFKDVPVIKDNLPDRQQLSSHFKRLRVMFAAESQ